MKLITCLPTLLEDCTSVEKLQALMAVVFCMECTIESAFSQPHCCAELNFM